MNKALSKQLKPQVEDPLLQESRNAFIHEQDCKLSEQLRVSAVTQTFTVQMTEACEKFSHLIDEILQYKKFFRLRFSFFPKDILLEVQPYWGTSTWTFHPLIYGEHGCFHGRKGHYHFASCIIQKDENGVFKPYMEILDNGYVVSGKAEVCNNGFKYLKYFTKKYTHKWMEKALRKELKRCIANKRFEADARVDAVS